MKKLMTLIAAMLLVLGMLAAPAAAQGPPRHGHILLLHLVFEGQEPVGYGKCVDLAAGRALPLKAHHETVHQGRASLALGKAGHAVVPTAPLTEWSNCAEFAEWLAANG